METVAVPQPVFRLIYDRKDITAALQPFVLQITYTDVLTGESDDLQINLSDRDHRWKNSWFPGQGDALQLSIGYEGHQLVNCGSFQIDEVELNGPPDTVSIRALAAGVNEALRTENSTGYEDMSFEEIAQAIAKKHNLKLTGKVSAKKRGRKKKRVTQKQEQDLAFLKRIGQAEGVVFSVKDGQLVWHDQDELDGAKTITIIKRTDVNTFTFRAKSNQVYKACEVTYFDPKKKQLITHQFKADGVTTGDVLKLHDRCENYDDAVIKAAAALRHQNGKQIEGTINLYGNPKLAAGANVEIQGFGVVDGGYQILKATHSLERGRGYTTAIELSTTLSKNKNMSNLKNLKRVAK
ncbi:MAG: Cro/Cl family transcriptional regulator [Geobacter sp.]|nr:Cro/Cl family transcriptional regulator [Geobacter sp.]